MEIAAGLAAGLAAVQVVTRERKRQRDRWRRAAKDLGLTFFPGGFRKIGQIQGTLGRIGVSIDDLPGGRYERILFEVTTPGIPLGLTITRAGVFRLGPREVRTGDGVFDLAATARGTEKAVYAALGRKVRALLVPFFDEHDAEISNGAVRLRTGKSPNHAPAIEATIRRMMRIASALAIEKTSEEAQLIANIEEETSFEVTKRMLDYVIREHPELTSAAARAGLKHPSAELRARAAVHLHKEGCEAMREILSNEASAPRLRKMAAIHLAAYGERQEIMSFIMAFMKTAPTELRTTAIELAGRWQYAPAKNAILECLHDPHPEVFSAAAAAASRLRDLRAVAPILARLSSDLADRDTMLAAIDALSDLGGRDEIAPLVELTKRFMIQGEVRRSAATVLLRIRRRIGPADEGRLSVVADHEREGAISVARQGGGVSIAESGDLGIVGDSSSSEP
jgi:HEAT repeat protein